MLCHHVSGCIAHPDVMQPSRHRRELFGQLDCRLRWSCHIVLRLVQVIAADLLAATLPALFYLSNLNMQLHQ